MIAPAALPPLYAHWLDDLLGGPIPAETNATCDDCAMLPDPESGEPGFNPATKCCTYLPDLWNYLAGGVLLDEHADAAPGRATVEARIDRGALVTPIGLGRHQTHKILYREGGASTFGRSHTMRCPHYLAEQGGLCGVWRHRESTCLTWFCKYVRGGVGQNFWSHLHQLLMSAEEAVSTWCVLELGLEPRALAELYRPYRNFAPKISPSDLDGEPDARERNAVWGNWLGREREFYRACAKLVAPLTWADVVRIGGAPVGMYAGLVQAAYTRLLNDAPPDRPVMALVQITPRGAKRVRLATYGVSDALEVPAVVANILPYFDGRPMAEALAEIERGEGVSVDPSLVRKLADFGVLKEA